MILLTYKGGKLTFTFRWSRDASKSCRTVALEECNCRPLLTGIVIFFLLSILTKTCLLQIIKLPKIPAFMEVVTLMMIN